MLSRRQDVHHHLQRLVQRLTSTHYGRTKTSVYPYQWFQEHTPYSPICFAALTRLVYYAIDSQKAPVSLTILKSVSP